MGPLQSSKHCHIFLSTPRYTESLCGTAVTSQLFCQLQDDASHADQCFCQPLGYNESYAELGTACGDRVKQRVISRGSKVFFKRTSHTAVRQVWLLFSLQRE